MGKNTSIDEDLELALSYKEKFPSVEHIFSNQADEPQKLLEDSIVVLDTNVLLVPYKLKSQDLNEIEKVYGQLSQEGRLLLPEHVAREFAVNKQTKLADLYKTVNDRLVKVPSVPDAAILNDLAEYKELDKEFKALNKKLDTYNQSVKKLAKQIKDWSWNDPVLNMYNKFFNKNSLVNHKVSDEDVGKELSRRQKHKIAPGYKDKSKDVNAAGDLNVWLTILELGETLKRNVIFVSEDRKPDWWNQSNGSPFSPKFELVNEYKCASGGKTIQLMIFSEFLEAFNVSAKTVEDVKKVEEEAYIEKLNFSKRQVKVQRKFRDPRRRNHYLHQLELEGKNPNSCESCGYTINSGRNYLELHHIKPLSEGGDDTFENMVLLCPNCHRMFHEKLRSV